MTIEEIKGKVTPILERYGVKKAAIFGSVVRGESKTSSDVDILVEIKSNIIRIGSQHTPPNVYLSIALIYCDHAAS